MQRLRRTVLAAVLVPGLTLVPGISLSLAEKPAQKPAVEAPKPEAAKQELPKAELQTSPLDGPEMPAASDVRQPYDMMRELRQLQDKIAQGDTEALVKQRQLTDGMAEAFGKLPDEVWHDPRNGRAILAFVLSGGDPRALRNLLLRGQPKSIDGNVARAVHAFVSGRRGEALDHFSKLDALTLDPTIAGQVALAQSELASRADPVKSLEKLDQARLLAPGTLIEEAALRRQIGLLSTRKDFASADKYTEVYFRRFPRSAYATTLKRQVVRFAMDRPPIDERSMTAFVAALDRLGPGARLEMYLEMAREAVARARRDLVIFSAEKALALTKPDTVYEARAKIYLNSMHAASLAAGEARDALEALKPRTENAEDLELITVSQAIAQEIRSLSTVTPSSRPDPQWVNELGATFSKVGRGQTLIADTDKILAEATK